MSYEYVSKKAIDWVEKCVDKELKRNAKKYNSVNERDGRIMASLKVSRNISDSVCNADVKTIQPSKFRFLVQADQYASRISNWYDRDSFSRSISHKPTDDYYKNENWRKTYTDY